jgi:hypothetical protein
MKLLTKVMSVVVALAMTTASSLVARDRDSYRQNNNMSPKMDQGHGMKESPMTGGYNAPARYDVKGAWDFFFTADFIYWQTRSDGLAYGVGTNRVVDPDTGLTTTTQRVLNNDFGWHPGVKLGLGLNWEHDDWDVFCEWTHLVAHSNTSARVRTGESIIPTLVIPTATIQGFEEQDRAFMSWRNIYNTIDAEMGRTYYVGKMLTFRPHYGIRASWFRQSYNVQYNDLQIVGIEEGGTVRVKSRYNDWGLGPRFGLDSSWILGCGFRLFGDAAFSLAWTSVSARKSQEAPDLDAEDAFINQRNNKANGNIRPNYDAAVGFGWGSYFDNANWHFDMAFAYEFHYWPDHNFDYYLVNEAPAYNDELRGNLALHGGTFMVRFDF